MTGYIELSYFDLALAALLLLFNAGLSLALGLRLERRMLLDMTFHQERRKFGIESAYAHNMMFYGPS